MSYQPSADRYAAMPCRRCGRSGLKLPLISLGLWHNFGGDDPDDQARDMVCRAFDLGITHFDLANNYGPPPGTAEETCGRILRHELGAHRDELVIASKAGYRMWPGPYGEWGSRKYLVASADQSLRRLGLDYVDIFYSHRQDPETPLAETMGALDHLVRSGRALYAGISNYPPAATREAAAILRQLGTPCLIHQAAYNLFRRDIEDGLLAALADEGMGCIAFSPLAQGMLSDKYLDGIPDNSRAARPHGFLKPQHLTPERMATIRRLNQLAADRGRSLAQLALAWVLRQPVVTSALIGASSCRQIEECVAVSQQPELDDDTLRAIASATMSRPPGRP